MRTSEAYFTPEEYIALERKAIPDAEIVRSEYMNGKIIGRSSSNLSHNLITGNIAPIPKNIPTTQTKYETFKTCSS